MSGVLSSLPEGRHAAPARGAVAGTWRHCINVYAQLWWSVQGSVLQMGGGIGAPTRGGDTASTWNVQGQGGTIKIQSPANMILATPAQPGATSGLRKHGVSMLSSVFPGSPWSPCLVGALITDHWFRSFLNQKPWHPSNFKNQARVYEAEQETIALAKRNALAKVSQGITVL